MNLLPRTLCSWSIAGLFLGLSIAAPLQSGKAASGDVASVKTDVATPAPESTPSALPATAASAKPADHDPDSGAELLGTPAPTWSFTRWVRGPKQSVASLHGKVVLVRWWTEGCHFCEATLPVLESLEKAHASEGFVVVGVFHPKPPHEVSDEHILGVAKKLGYSGAIALDRDWKTLDRYWLAADPDRNWTSVSFLIDRDGIIRWVHGGGEYHPSTDPRHHRCDVQYADLERALAAALAERSASRTP
jgi:thiol-disulfide isomerase/thioredoxin